MCARGHRPPAVAHERQSRYPPTCGAAVAPAAKSRRAWRGRPRQSPTAGPSARNKANATAAAAACPRLAAGLARPAASPAWPSGRQRAWRWPCHGPSRCGPANLVNSHRSLADCVNFDLSGADHTASNARGAFAPVPCAAAGVPAPTCAACRPNPHEPSRFNRDCPLGFGMQEDAVARQFCPA